MDNDINTNEEPKEETSFESKKTETSAAENASPYADLFTAYGRAVPTPTQIPAPETDATSEFKPATGYTPYAAPVGSTYSAASTGQGAYSETTQSGYSTAREGGIRTTYVTRPAYGTAPEQGTTPEYTGGASVHHEAETATKKKAKKKSGKAGIALLIIGCMLISLLCGAGGVYVGTLLADKGASATGSKGGAEPTYSTDQVDKEYKAPDGSVAGAAAIAKDSIVEITTESLTTSAFFGQYVTSGAGSGVIIDAEKGYIATCAHVVEGATSITVNVADGTSYEAKIIGSDSRTDIAVISIEAKGLAAAKIGSSAKLVVGETAIAVGNPLGTLGGTVTSGIISALDREITIDGQKFTLLQIDTSINPGNSGGGLFDINGNLIGIVNAKSSGSSMSSTTIEGLGFAIPIDKAIEVVQQLTEKGYVGGRAFLGISVVEITSSTSQSSIYQNGYGDLMNYITDYGVYFVDYLDGQNGDLLYGDRIVAIDGTSVSTKSDVSSLLEEYSIGDTVKVTVSRLNSDKRRSQMVDVNVTLLEYIPTAAASNSSNG